MKAKAKSCILGMLAATTIALQSTASQAHDEGAKRACDVSMLRGLYLFKGTGFNFVNGGAVPKAIIESIRFNGDGTLVAETVTLTILGQTPPVRHQNTPGVYTVESNCTGTVAFSDGPAFDTFVSSPWLLSLIQTGPVPAVLQGDARFVSR